MGTCTLPAESDLGCLYRRHLLPRAHHVDTPHAFSACGAPFPPETRKLTRPHSCSRCLLDILKFFILEKVTYVARTNHSSQANGNDCEDDCVPFAASTSQVAVVRQKTTSGSRRLLEACMPHYSEAFMPYWLPLYTGQNPTYGLHYTMRTWTVPRSANLPLSQARSAYTVDFLEKQIAPKTLLTLCTSQCGFPSGLGFDEDGRVCSHGRSPARLRCDTRRRSDEYCDDCYGTICWARARHRTRRHRARRNSAIV